MKCFEQCTNLQRFSLIPARGRLRKGFETKWRSSKLIFLCSMSSAILASESDIGKRWAIQLFSYIVFILEVVFRAVFRITCTLIVNMCGMSLVISINEYTLVFIRCYILILFAFYDMFHTLQSIVCH